ncbi:MAG: hypothetical protein FH761_08510 [Firmicutes bacterium]|nr:hypothetical protein [Bacillota bacterium]
MDDNVLSELLERVVRIETKIDGYNNLREKLDKTYGIAVNNKDDIKEIKDNQKWLWRTFASVLIVSFVSAFVIWGG